jgi:CHAD domain-containing protein
LDTAVLNGSSGKFSMRLQGISKPSQPLDQLRTQLQRQLSCARDELRCSDAAHVHAARKQVKKGRATLRLLRPAIGEDNYTRENTALRDAARPISGLRDAQVLAITYRKMRSRSDDGQQHPGLDSAEEALLAHTRAVQQAHEARPDQLQQISQVIEGSLERISSWDLDRENDVAAMIMGLRQTYRRGRRTMLLASRETTTEHLHDWRKQAKYLWHQLELLCSVAPGEIGELADQCHRLSDYLGDEHDFAVLEEVLSSLSYSASEGERAFLASCLEHCRDRLRAKAFTSGARVYRRRSGIFAAHMQLLWARWSNGETADGRRQDAAGTVATEPMSISSRH